MCRLHSTSYRTFDMRMADSWRLERRAKWKNKRLPFNIHIFKDSYANPYQKYFIKKEEYTSLGTTRTLAYIPTGNKFNKMLRDFYTLISNFSLFFCVSRVIRYSFFFSTSSIVSVPLLSLFGTYHSYVQPYISVSNSFLIFLYFIKKPSYT